MILRIYFAIAIVALLLAVAKCAEAHDPEAGPEINACLKTLYSKSGDHCCNGDDVEKVLATWDYEHNGYVVVLENPHTGEKKTYDVPERAIVLGDKCGVGRAMIWWTPDYGIDDTMTPRIRCFEPGAGG